MRDNLYGKEIDEAKKIEDKQKGEKENESISFYWIKRITYLILSI